MHNSATLSLPLATPLRVPQKSEAALSTRTLISLPAAVPRFFQSRPGRLFPEGGGVAVSAQREEDPEQGDLASRGAPPPLLRAGDTACGCDPVCCLYISGLS